MIDLPFSFSGGRLMENLAHKIAAGVNGNRWQNTSNGLPYFSKDVLLDGASVSSWAPGIFVLTAVSMEAVGEFKMQTSGMSAEYGRSAGGIYNYVMKSGTNELHGTAYGSLRNEALNANSFANNARGVRAPARPQAKLRVFLSAARSGFRNCITARIAPSSTSPTKTIATAI